MNFGRFLATTVAQLRMTFRRRITLFWSLVFPMILMTLLGLLFGRSVSAGTIAVAPVNAPAPAAVVKALEHTKGLTVKIAPNPGKAIHQVRNGDRDAAVVFAPASGGSYLVKLYTSNTSADQAGIIRGSSRARPTGSRWPPPDPRRRSPSGRSRSTPRRSPTSTSCCRGSWRSRS